jgi:hypothetical protein
MLIKDVFIKRHRSHAGKWIYEGYKLAWQELGYSAHYYDSLSEIKHFKEGYYLMALGGDINNQEALDVLSKSRKTFLYVQPNHFPHPWGRHPNFQCHCPDVFISKVNSMKNVHLWSFGMPSEYHNKWKEVNTIPLAFDSINYRPVVDDRYEYDVCFVGGWANNGFDEKRKIMLEYFGEFKDSGLKCGFFVNKSLTHEQENAILYNSKVSVNIHDAYQRTLGLDTNERTFKSLGTNGILVSDNIEQIKDLGINVVLTDGPKEMVDAVRRYVFDITPEERLEMKELHRQEIIREHTYIKRAEALLELK